MQCSAERHPWPRDSLLSGVDLGDYEHYVLEGLQFCGRPSYDCPGSAPGRGDAQAGGFAS
jgi:hypothetical protein